MSSSAKAGPRVVPKRSAGPRPPAWLALGELAGGIDGSIATATNADGSILVGSASTESGGYQAMIWDSVHGMRNLKMVLENDFGLDLSGWDLTGAADISDDGLTIVGSGINSGRYEAWIAVIPEPASWVLLLAGLQSVWHLSDHRR